MEAQEADYYDDWEDEDEEEDLEETEDEQVFPIGYTIDFSAESQSFDKDDDGSGQAPRGGLGSQALPVSDKLRADWDGVPADGAEYLFTVRREALARPRVVTKENPYKLSKPSPGQVLIGRKPKASPSPSWRKQFVTRFVNMRRSIQDQDPWHWNLAEEFRRPPPANDESNWKIFISGKKTNLADYPPRAPMPLFLKALEQTTVLAVLSHYQTWIQEKIHSFLTLVQTHASKSCSSPPAGSPAREEIVLLSSTDGSWLLGLLSVLDTVLTAEDIYKLRELARVCKQVIDITEAALEVAEDHSVVQESGVAWMVLAAVTDVWGQKDLWED